MRKPVNEMLNPISIFRLIAVTVLVFSLSACSVGVRDITSVERPAPGRSSVTGTILMEDGSPEANAEVHLCENLQTFVGCSGRIGITKTDASGRFWFRNIPPTNYAPAVLIDENKFVSFTLEKEKTAVPKALTYNVEADQTIELPPFRMNTSLNVSAMESKPSVQIVSPKLSESTAERRPAFRWEAFPGANFYVVHLYQLPEPGREGKHFWSETSRGFGDTAATNLIADVVLESGVYQWHVEAYNKVSEFQIGEPLGTSNKNHGYFTVAVN